MVAIKRTDEALLKEMSVLSIRHFLYYSIPLLNSEIYSNDYKEKLPIYFKQMSDDERFFIEKLVDLKYKSPSFIFNKNLDSIFKMIFAQEIAGLKQEMCIELYHSKLNDNEKKFISFFINKKTLEKLANLRTDSLTFKRFAALSSFIVLDFAKKLNMKEDVMEKYFNIYKKNDIFLGLCHKCQMIQDDNLLFLQSEDVGGILLKNVYSSMHKDLMRVLKKFNQEKQVFHCLYFIEDENMSQRIMFQQKELYTKKNVEFVIAKICTLIHEKKTVNEVIVQSLFEQEALLNTINVEQNKRAINKIKL